MTIVRSLGVTALVALMSAHRAAMEQCNTTTRPFEQAAVDAMEAYLRWTEIQSTGSPDPSSLTAQTEDFGALLL
jgi:hypothetical protein